MTETLKTANGRTLTYEPPAGGEGWARGTLGGVDIHVYVRPKEHGGGVFIKHDGKLHDALTGEATVRFNNRLWTQTEEAEEMERIRTSHD